MMANNEGLTVRRYLGEDDIPVHEIDLPSFNIREGEKADDNCFIGSYGNINVYTMPSWYLKAKPRVSCKSANIPFEKSWTSLEERYPKGKVLKLKKAFYEVVSITVNVPTETVNDRSFTHTMEYSATVHVKPFGMNDDTSDGIISIVFNNDWNNR